MKNKNNVYVEVESKEQAETYRKVLELMGEKISSEYNFGLYDTNSIQLNYKGNWFVSFHPVDLDFEKITFGELIDLLQRKPLLISEDGIPLYGEEDIFMCFIDSNTGKAEYKKSCFINTCNYTSKIFYSESKALEWIESQKPKSITVELFTLQINAICTSDKVTIKDLDEEFSVVISKEKLAEINKAMEELA